MGCTFVESLTFNEGTVLDLEPDSIVVFVGPNNVGKSQALRDVYSHIGQSSSSIVIRDISFTLPDRDSFIELLEDIAVKCDGGREGYSGLNFHIDEFVLNTYERGGTPAHKAVQQALFACLDASARLGICNPPSRTDFGQPKTHPILFVADDDSVCRCLSNAFNRAFGQELSPNLFFGGSVPLCMGPQIKVPGGMTQTQLAEFFNGKYRDYPMAHEQGDGVKGYLGILLYLVIDYFCGYFIDEPEAFLHPPQAAVLGVEIARNSNERQVFLATHSKELLAGLLEAGAGRVKVVRITREGDRNRVLVLGSEDVVALSATTLLKYSDVINALFHDSVVLCESDADCKFYSVIASQLREGAGSGKWPLFVPVGGKHRFRQYVDLLKGLGIDVKVVADIDVLDDRGTLKSLLGSCCGDWSAIEQVYGEFCRSLEDKRSLVSLDVLRSEIDAILEKSPDAFVHDNQVDELKKILPHGSRWRKLKEYGAECLRGDQINHFKRIDGELRKSGIHLVRVGELENFVKEVTAHGPAWVNDVLERFPDFSDEAYGPVKEFVGEWL